MITNQRLFVRLLMAAVFSIAIAVTGCSSDDGGDGGTGGGGAGGDGGTGGGGAGGDGGMGGDGGTVDTAQLRSITRGSLNVSTPPVPFCDAPMFCHVPLMSDSLRWSR